MRFTQCGFYGIFAAPQSYGVMFWPLHFSFYKQCLTETDEVVKVLASNDLSWLCLVLRYPLRRVALGR